MKVLTRIVLFEKHNLTIEEKSERLRTIELMKKYKNLITTNRHEYGIVTPAIFVIDYDSMISYKVKS
jgi:hypothetical protein